MPQLLKLVVRKPPATTERMPVWGSATIKRAHREEKTPNPRFFQQHRRTVGGAIRLVIGRLGRGADEGLTNASNVQLGGSALEGHFS
jgi:hypothetical protein